jgi:hypothetical protein
MPKARTTAATGTPVVIRLLEAQRRGDRVAMERIRNANRDQMSAVVGQVRAEIGRRAASS